MLYEQIVAIEPTTCIALSEYMEQSTSSTESMEQYLNKFRDMVGLLTVHRRTPLKSQPLFQWQGRTSACWKFEEHRVMHALHAMIMTDAKKCFDNCDYKGAKVLLGRAVDVAKEMLFVDWCKTPGVRGMPELQLPYLMSVLFRTKGTYYFTMHSFKSNKVAAKTAYQYVELSNCLWRSSADQAYAAKMKAHYHYAFACESDNFKEIISHSTAAVGLLQDPKMLEDHTVWVEQNNTVHYETVEDVTCPTIGVEFALTLTESMDDAFIISHLQEKIGGTCHVCTSKCVTRPLRVHVHQKDGEHIRWAGNNKPWMNKSTFKRSLQYVYVCQSSRTVHHCTRECALEPVPNNDHTLVCPVSGVQWDNETEVVRSWKLTSKCVPCIVSDKRDPNMFSRDVDGNVMSDTLNIKDESCKRTVHKILRLLVCSQQRKAHELEKFRIGKQNALKQVNRYAKYSKKKGIVNACTAMNIYTTECFRRPNFVRIMSLYEPKLEQYTSDLYPIIIRLWKIMFKPRVFTFDIFVPAMLYIMQRGIRVNEVEVVKPYSVLEIILPDANVLDEFGIAKSTFTQTKNAIRAAVRNILESMSTQDLKSNLH